ncbi:MAG TPA: MMPL family transporter [Candidatus Saccharimonadales bacterium]|jgi:RND superfamily putative drug exporter|nr:MMPL family transporter [Candidatus Saccharimonadales bacterium]
MFAAWGHLVYRFRWAFLIVSGALMAVSVVVSASGGDLKSGGIIQTSESGRAAQLMEKELPRSSGTLFTVVFDSQTLVVTDPAYKAAVDRSLAGVRADPRVQSVLTAYDPGPQAASLVSRDQHALIAVVSTKDDSVTAGRYYPELRATIVSDVLSVQATGYLAVNHDFNAILETDLQRAEYVSLPLALILLLLVFGTVLAAMLPLGVGMLAVVGGIAATFALSHATDVSQYALNIVTLIGLGVAIDYSLFIVNRFREELARGRTVEDAIARSMATAGRAITFSGLTVAIGLAGMFFYQGTFLASMGYAGALVVAIAVFYGLTFLPAVLSLLGPRVNSLRLSELWRRLRGRPVSTAERGPGLWHRLATAVMARPLVVLIPVLAFILLAGSPFLRLRLANGDVDMLPPGAESRVALHTQIDRFPGQDQNSFQIVIHYLNGSDPLSAENAGALYDLSHTVAAIPGILHVASVVDAEVPLTKAQVLEALANPASLPPAAQAGITQSIGKDIAVLNAFSADAIGSDRSRDELKQIRAIAAPPGAELLVTGFTAYDVDAINFILGKTPAAVGFVVLATYVVLFLLLGSVVLPLKAVLMNFLSISASFGALVWIFQDGHLSSWLNFTPSSIDPTLPVIMFCIVFGLSMDYEVLLLSRMQEEYHRTHDNRFAVAEGLERIGRLITGAAAIMVGVFLAFALAEVVIIKAIGLGMAIAVAIDATLVRALVVPATMRLLGDLNWWAPRPLARLYRRLGLGEAHAVVEPAPVGAD